MSDSVPAASKKSYQIGLFATCLVDLFRPSVGMAAVQLLEQAGCIVHVPVQTCCGQPAFNAGDKSDAKRIARQVIENFEAFDFVVIPSGSCGGMMARHYPELFSDEPDFLPKVQSFAAKCYELVSFLYDILSVQDMANFAPITWPAHATYHDSCSGLRELGIKHQPRALLAKVEGLTLTEMPNCEVCCGFGGLFCVKYPEISTAIVTEKTDDIEASGADLLLAGDLGCLMNMAGRLSRLNKPVAVRHIAEVLAGQQNIAPLCQPLHANLDNDEEIS